MNTRDNFHAWLITQGFRPDIAPITHNGIYVSSKVHELWECWQAAQPQWHASPEVPTMDQREFGWPNSRVVLAFNGQNFSLAYLEQIDEDAKPCWRDSGSEGWILNGITHWMELPGAPS